jgi:hypothetical protein
MEQVTVNQWTPTPPAETLAYLIGAVIIVVGVCLLPLLVAGHTPKPKPKRRSRPEPAVMKQEVPIRRNELPRKSGNTYTADELRQHLDPDTPVSINRQTVGTVGKILGGTHES